MKNNIIYFVILLLLVLLFVQVRGRIIAIEEADQLMNDNVSLRIDSLQFSARIDTLGREIVKQNQIIVSQDQAIALGMVKMDSLKRLKSSVRVNTIIKIDSILLAADTIVIKETPDGVFMLVPVPVNYRSDHLSIDGYIRPEGVQIDSLRIPNTTEVVIGDFKRGFLRKSQPSVVIRNSNPFLKTESVSNVIVQEKTPWYNTRLAYMGGGFLIAALLLK